MLISMPHGTSTIFGAFQAILALLGFNGRTSALPVKVARDEKFATKFFVFETLACLAAPQQNVPQVPGWEDQSKSRSRVSFPIPLGNGMGTALFTDATSDK
jgi:hypothetical protein